MPPDTAALKVEPGLTIHEICDTEPEYFIFVIISSDPFLSHDLFLIKLQENYSWSIFKTVSICRNSWKM